MFTHWSLGIKSGLQSTFHFIPKVLMGLRSELCALASQHPPNQTGKTFLYGSGLRTGECWHLDFSFTGTKGLGSKQENRSRPYCVPLENLLTDVQQKGTQRYYLELSSFFITETYYVCPWGLSRFFCYFKLCIVYVSLIACSLLFLPCLCWHIASFLRMLTPLTVNQRTSVKPTAGCEL